MRIYALETLPRPAKGVRAKLPETRVLLTDRPHEDVMREEPQKKTESIKDFRTVSTESAAIAKTIFDRLSVEELEAYQQLLGEVYFAGAAAAVRGRVGG